jgi:GT2 family glycosyltransferase
MLLRESRAHDLLRFLWAKLLPWQAYKAWIRRNEPTGEQLERQRQTPLAGGSRISVIVPSYNAPPAYLAAMVDSVRAQTYPNWQLCIADGSSHDPAVRLLLQEYASADARIRLTLLPDNRGIAGNSNAALAMATGDYVALLDHDDLLPPFALYEVARCILENPGADFLYSDEDKIDSCGRTRKEHHFKPDWSPDLLRGQNYITHLSVFRRALLEEIGAFRPGFDGSQDYELILRASERAQRIVHIPKVLYHWRSHRQSVAGDSAVKMYAYEAGRRALADHMKRVGLQGEVYHGPVLGTYQVRHNLRRQPLVSIIVCGLARGRRGLASSVTPNSYPAVELIQALPSGVADTAAARMVGGSSATGPAQLNAVAARASGEVLLFLSAAAVPINPDWLERMLEHVQRPDVGAVGAKLYHADGSVAHAGFILGVAGGVGQAHRHFLRSAPGYGCRLITVQNLSAVSGACLMTTKKVFDELGGFDARLRGAWHDVDYCLRVRKRGYLVVWTPAAELYYRETRQAGRAGAVDRAWLRAKWANELDAGDPYYNPNLTRDWEDFSLSTGCPATRAGRRGKDADGTRPS